MSKPVWRFIAGAVCPRCGAMDTVRVDPARNLRDCVGCGFTDERPRDPVPVAPPTRVTRAKARRIETPAEPVRLLATAAPKPPSDEN